MPSSCIVDFDFCLLGFLNRRDRVWMIGESPHEKTLKRRSISVCHTGQQLMTLIREGPNHQRHRHSVAIQETR